MGFRVFTYCLTMILSLLVISMPVQAQQNIQKVSAHIFARQAENGQKTVIQGDLYFTSDGKLLSHFTDPKSYIMITNKKGEVRIYNQEENSVMQFQNELFSSNAMPFYYFFSGKTKDMGLKQSGYKIVKTNFKDNLTVTLWQPINKKPKDPIAFVKLVHKQANPIYMDYEDAHKKVIRKSYYYNYTNLNGVDFPKAFTEILYNDKDSVITKTEYSDFKVNEQANSSYFNFKIPTNAKLIKQ